MNNNIVTILEEWCGKENLNHGGFSTNHYNETTNFIAVVSVLYHNLPLIDTTDTIYSSIPTNRLAECFLVDERSSLNLCDSEIHAILWLLENISISKHTRYDLSMCLGNWSIFGDYDDEYVRDWLLWLITTTTNDEIWLSYLKDGVSDKERIRQLANIKTIDKKLTTAPKMFINIGASGSGKSTVCKLLSEKYNDLFYFSRDDLLVKRFECMFPNTTDPHQLYSLCWEVSTQTKQFDKDVFKLFQDVLSRKQNIIVDNTNVSRQSRAKFVTDPNAAEYITAAVLFPITLRELLKRRKQRGDKTIPFSAVTTQYSRIQQPWPNVEFDIITFADTLKKEG